MIPPPPLATLSAAVTEDEFWALLGRPEHERLDFKIRPDGIADTVAAMAMTDGGLIVCGIANNREIRGCSLTQDVRDAVLSAAHGCTVTVDIREIAVAGTPVVIAEVPEIADRVVTTPNGRLLRRVGSHSTPLVGEALVRFVMERAGHAAEDDLILDPRIWDEIDIDVVNAARAGAGRPPVRMPDLQQALLDLGVADLDGTGECRPTKAAAVLFARDPRRWVSGASVQIVRRVGVASSTGTTQLRREIAGPLPLAVDEVIALIEANTNRLESVVRTHREVLPEYPTIALREAVMNALAHRDYGLAGATIDVTIWDDRIEIRSPGPLPGHITLENLRDQHYSRNRRLMRVLKVLRLVEEYGEGVDRMIDAMEQRLMDAPTFMASPASFMVTIRNRSLLSPDEQVWFALLGHLDLSRDERRLLAIVKRDGSVTPRSLRRLLPEIDVDRLVKGAVTKGLLWRTGNRGGTRYILSFEIAMRGGVLEVHTANAGQTQPMAALELRTRQRHMLLDEVRARGSLTAAQAGTLLPRESPQVARDLLDDLVQAGSLAVTGRTRGRRYVPSSAVAPDVAGRTANQAPPDA